MAENHRRWGQISQLPSGNYRVRYYGPDGVRYPAPFTFETHGAADTWLSATRTAIEKDKWESPEAEQARLAIEAELAAQEAREKAAKSVKLKTYGNRWIIERIGPKGKPLTPKTRSGYTQLLDNVLVELAETSISDITPALVRTWYATQMARGTITQTSRAYDLLKSILKTAVEDKLLDANPCQIKGGGAASTGIEVLPPTDEEYEKVMEAMNPTYQALAVIAAAGGLRWGEITELRVRDVDIERNEDGDLGAVRINVRRGVTYTPETGKVVGDTKSTAGRRKIAIFGLEAAIVAAHVESRSGASTLLFTSVNDPTKHLSQSTFHRHWNKARLAAGRGDMPLHALRHYQGTRYAQTGATLKEIMARLGHSSTVAAMRYQHAGSRDDELAKRLAR